MKKYGDDLIQKLQASKETVERNGVVIQLKRSPDAKGAGYLDPHEKATMAGNWAADIMSEEKQPDSDASSLKPDITPEQLVKLLREMMGFPNLNLNTQEMKTKYEQLKSGDNEVGLWRYYKRRSVNQKRSCLIYIHGGGWIGGETDTMENTCKLIAELADAVVFNIDYSLAPEKPYPNGFLDCYHAVKHIYEHAEAYGIDPDKIAVGGDSAGGNITAAITVKARDEGIPMVAMQILIYPCIALGGIENELEGFSVPEDFYQIAGEEAHIIKPLLSFGLNEPSAVPDIMSASYVQNPQDFKLPYVSPILTALENLPKALIASAEFDGLRVQIEYYAKRLKESGVEVRNLRYCGMTHAFFDKLGHVPQTEDLCIEIAEALRNM